MILSLAQRTFLTDLMLIGGLLLVTTSMLMMLRKRRARAASAPTPREKIEQIRQQRGIRGDLENLMVEIEQMAKRLSAHLDSKSIRIERLLREADQQIARLERLKSTGGYPADPTPDPSQASNDPHASTGNGPSPSPPSNTLNLNGPNAAASPHQTTSAHRPAPSPQPAGATDEQTDPDEALTQSIYQMADQGAKPMDIAKQLNEHLGKVELILALRDAG